MTAISLSRGQRINLTDIVPDNSEFQIDIACSSLGLAIDFSCFGLDDNEKLLDECYRIFFDQPSTPCGGIFLKSLIKDNALFTISLQKLPTTISRLAIIVAIDGNGTMSQIVNGYVQFLVREIEVARFVFVGSDFSEERALSLLEIYRKDGIWRISTTGQGFNTGLETLVKHFCVTVTDPEINTPSVIPSLTTQANFNNTVFSEATTILYSEKDINNLLQSGRIVDWLAGAHILSQDSVSDDLLLSTFQGLFRSLKKVDMIDAEDEKQILYAIERLRSRVDPAQWLRAFVAKRSYLEDYIHIFLPIANYPSDALQDLILSICENSVGEKTKEHLFLLLSNIEEDETFSISSPLLREIGKSVNEGKEISQLEYRNALCWLDAREEKKLVDHAQVLVESDPILAAGILIVLSHKPSTYSRVAATNLLSNVTASEKFAGALLEKERVSATVSRIRESGLESAISVVLSEVGTDTNKLCEAISKSYLVKKALGRFLGTPGALLGFFRLLVDPLFLSGIREIFSDSDLPVRRAAAHILANEPAVDNRQALISGLTDCDSQVREVCSRGLLELLGPQEFENVIKNIEHDALTIRQSLGDLQGWLGSAVQQAGKGFESLVDKARDTAQQAGDGLESLWKSAYSTLSSLYKKQEG